MYIVHGHWCVLWRTRILCTWHVHVQHFFPLYHIIYRVIFFKFRWGVPMAVNWEKYKVWGSATYNLKIWTILSFYFVGPVSNTNKKIVGFSELYFCLLNIYELFWELSLNTLGKTHIFTLMGPYIGPMQTLEKTHVYYLEMTVLHKQFTTYCRTIVNANKTIYTSLNTIQTQRW